MRHCLLCFLFSWLLLIAAYSLPVPSLAQSLPPVFNLAMHNGGPSGPGYSASEPQAMVTDAQGNTYIKGSFSGTVKFGTITLAPPVNTSSGYLVKLAPDGTYLWALEHPAFSWVDRALALDNAGNIYITVSYSGTSLNFGAVHLTSASSTSSKLVVVKINPDGTYLWGRQIEGSCGITAQSLAVDALDNVYLTGYFNFGSIQIGSNVLTNTDNSSTHSTNLFVAKLGASGTWLWGAQSVRQSYNYNSEQAESIAVDAAGDVYLTGTLGSTSASMGTTMLSNPYSFTTDAFVAKLSSTGSWLWAHRIGAPGYDHGMAVAVDKTGNPYFYGNIHGTPDVDSHLSLTPTNGAFELFVAKLAPDGTVLWATTAGGTEAEVAGNMVLDAAGNAYVTGWFDSAPAHFGTTALTNTGLVPSHDVFVAKLNATGQWQWALAAAGTYAEEGVAVSVDFGGNVWLTGVSRSASINFGQLALTGVYPRSYGFLARIADAQIATVAGVAPNSGNPGQVVTITGTHFAGVQSVEFNGTPATAFTVISTTALRATVPTGASSGPVTVRTSAGTSSNGTLFQITPLAATSPLDAALRIWPNPIGCSEALHLELPGIIQPNCTARVSMTSLVGNIVRQHDFAGRTTEVPLTALASGVYVLTLQVAGLAPVVRRIVVE